MAVGRLADARIGDHCVHDNSQPHLPTHVIIDRYGA